MFGSSKCFLIFTLLLTKTIKTMTTILGTDTAWIIAQMQPKPTPQSQYYTNSTTKN